MNSWDAIVFLRDTLGSIEKEARIRTRDKIYITPKIESAWCYRYATDEEFSSEAWQGR